MQESGSLPGVPPGFGVGRIIRNSHSMDNRNAITIQLKNGTTTLSVRVLHENFTGADIHRLWNHVRNSERITIILQGAELICKKSSEFIIFLEDIPVAVDNIP